MFRGLTDRFETGEEWPVTRDVETDERMPTLYLFNDSLRTVRPVCRIRRIMADVYQPTARNGRQSSKSVAAHTDGFT